MAAGDKDLAAALTAAGWDHQFVFGPGGGHDFRQAALIFPETLRRLWRDAAK